MRYDVIIVGGGLVGSSLALALSDLPLRVALVEARLPTSEDPRLFALNISSIQLLSRLGIWPAVEKAASPITAVHVSHRGHFGAVRLNASDADLPTLGHVVPAFRIEAAMHERLSAETRMTRYCPARVVAIHPRGTETELVLKAEGEELTLSSPLIIAADGTESTLREALNIPTETVDYHQTAIVSKIQVSAPHRGVAYERFADGGALAMLPLPDQTCASIWSAPTDQANELLQLSDADYLAACQSLMGHRLGRLVSVSARAHFPLRMKRALTGVSQHVFLLGNALHTLHPIAAQGFNLALYEVATLVEGFVQGLARGEAITPDTLQALNESTQTQQNISVGVSHVLAHLFTKPQPGLSTLAGLCMAGLDCLPPLKKRFIQRMTGRAGRVPPLLTSN